MRLVCGGVAIVCRGEVCLKTSRREIENTVATAASIEDRDTATPGGIGALVPRKKHLRVRLLDCGLACAL